jgi:hypothetical protein
LQHVRDLHKDWRFACESFHFANLGLKVLRKILDWSRLENGRPLFPFLSASRNHHR